MDNRESIEEEERRIESVMFTNSPSRMFNQSNDSEESSIQSDISDSTSDEEDIIRSIEEEERILNSSFLNPESVRLSRELARLNQSNDSEESSIQSDINDSTSDEEEDTLNKLGKDLKVKAGSVLENGFDAMGGDPMNSNKKTNAVRIKHKERKKEPRKKNTKFEI